MLLVDLLRLAVAILLAWGLRPHVALLWRFAFPGRVRHRLDPGGVVPDSDVARELVSAGFIFLGRREECVGRFLERREFFVFAHPEGIFADVPAGSRGKWIPAGLYFSSFVEDALFLVTKRVGPEVVRGMYVSQRETGSVGEMLRRHRAALARLGMGLSAERAPSAAEREKLFAVWHREHARTELRPFALLSAVLCLVGAAFLVRIFTFSY